MNHSNALEDNNPVTKYRHDYKAPPFLVDNIDLVFQLFEDKTWVFSKMTIKRNPDSQSSDAQLTLDGEALVLKQLLLNSEEVSEQNYSLNDEGLTLDLTHYPIDSSEFTLETKVEILPHKNTSLSGLYVSSQKFCTQCEAEGFRRITYFPDRPDVLSKFSVRIEADKTKYPFLLSNGNRVKQGDLDEGRHFVEWDDPFLKPCYLFALVAGDFDVLNDTFETRSGREISLQVFVEEGKLAQSHYAMASLKNAMRWDEERFNLEYDLDLYMIVAVSDFNMGAMENKGLNVFNTKYVLADTNTATDDDFEGVEAVIGHEYFHNWTGNRVTCRDWFQLSLKEGLTVFRDQEFTGDQRSHSVKRIDDVKVIRSVQFAEDAGPMSHPIRPDSYIEMNNFYTVTVYNKGAEVIRMMHTLLGEAGFQKGMALYFKRHDGQAVTCDDFVAAMADANDYDLTQFKHWYSQSGTPSLSVDMTYDKDKLTLTFQQTCAKETQKPFLIPVKMGLLTESGDVQSFALNESGELCEETVIHVTEALQKVTLYRISEPPVLSLLRDFSAPVQLVYTPKIQDTTCLFMHDSNEFSRWDAGQQLMGNYIIHAESSVDLETMNHAFKRVIHDQSIDNALKARVLTCPDLKTLFGLSTDIDVIVERRKQLRQNMAEALSNDWLHLYETNEIRESDTEKEAIGKRAVRNVALHYLSLVGENYLEKVVSQFENSRNMTEQLAALCAAVHQQMSCADDLLEKFYQQWHKDALVMDKWLSVQASLADDAVIEKITQLSEHPVFDIKNPNKVRSLYASFAGGNFAQFNRKDGKGYQLILKVIETLDPINPQIAARLSTSFSIAPRLDATRQSMIKTGLTELIEKSLSKDVFEIVSKTLNQIK